MPRIDCFKHIKGNKELEKHFSSIGEDLPESEQRDKAIELANEYYKIIHADMNVLNTLLKKPRVIFKPKNNLAQIKKVKEDADAKIKALTNQAEGADVQKASDTPRQYEGIFNPNKGKAVEQSLKETPQVGSVGLGGDKIKLDPDLANIDPTIVAARNGDKQAQKKLEEYGLDWEQTTTYRFVGQSEVDVLLSDNKVESKRFTDAGIDVTTSDKVTSAANNEYRVTFKESFDVNNGLGKVKIKSKEEGDHNLEKGRGYDINDVAKIERIDEKGNAVETIYEQSQAGSVVKGEGKQGEVLATEIPLWKGGKIVGGLNVTFRGVGGKHEGIGLARWGKGLYTTGSIEKASQYAYDLGGEGRVVAYSDAKPKKPIKFGSEEEANKWVLEKSKEQGISESDFRNNLSDYLSKEGYDGLNIKKEGVNYYVKYAEQGNNANTNKSKTDGKSNEAQETPQAGSVGVGGDVEEIKNKNWFHGSENEFNTFENKNPNITGFWFSDSKENAMTYGNKVKQVSLDVKNPLVIDAKGKKFTDDIEVEVLAKYPNEEPYITKIGMDIDEIVWMAKNGKRKNSFIELVNSGYDAVVFKNIIDPSLSSRSETPQTSIAVLDKNQIKQKAVEQSLKETPQVEQTKNIKNETESKNEVETSNVGKEVRKGKIEPSSSKTESPKAKGKQLTNNESNRLKVASSLDLYGVPLYDMIAQAMMSLKFSGNVLQEILGRKESVVRFRKNIKEDATQRLNWTRGWKTQPVRIESVGRLSEIAWESLSDTDREIYDSQDVLNVVESVILDFTSAGKISTYLIDKYLDGDINSTIEETIEKRQQQAYEDYGIPEGWDKEKGDWIDERYKKAHEGLLSAIDLLTDEDFESILNDSEAYFNSDEYKASLDAENNVKLSSRQESKESKEYQSAKRAYDNKRKELYGSAMNDSADLFGNVKSQENSLFGDQTEKADEAKIAKALEPYKVRLDNAKKALEKANKDAQAQGTLFNAKKGDKAKGNKEKSTLKKLISALQKAIKANVFSSQELLKQKLKEYGLDYTKLMADFSGIKQVEMPKGMKIVDDGEGNFALLDKNGINISGWGSFSDIEESVKDEFPIGTKEIKDATSLDILSNVNKFTLKQLISILQYNDRNGEWQSEFDKLEKYGSRVDERKLLKDARVAVKDLAEGMLKDDGFDDYFMDIKSDYKGEEVKDAMPVKLMRTPNGVIYGAKFPDGSIYINNEDIDLSSPIHEFSHLFEEMYPELWAEGLRLFRDSSGFKKALKEVQDNPAYSNLTEAKQASEALNNLIGNKGVGYFAKGVLLSKFQNWVNKLFKTIGNRIGKKYVDKIGKKFGDKVAQKLTLTPDDSLEFFVNDVLGKLLSGKELQGETQSPTEGSLGIVGNVAKSLFKQEPKTVEIEVSNSQVDLDTPPRITKLKSGEYVVQTPFKDSYVMVDGEMENPTFKDLSSANEFYINETNRYNKEIERTKSSTQHSIDITPELKAQVSEGLPMFMVRQNETQATKSEIDNAISSLDVAVSDYENDDSIDNYLSLNDAFETLAYTSIGDAQSMAKDLSAKYPELKDDFDSIINEASKPKVESKKVTNESDAIRTLISEEVDGRLYPTIVDSLGKFEKQQDTAKTTSEVQGREVSGEYVRLTLQNMKDIATQKALQLQDVLGEDWVKKSIEFFEREPFSGNPAIIIGLSNIISSDLDAQIKATTDIKELDALVALQNRMDRVVNRNGRVASLALNYRRIFTSFAQGDSVTDSMAGNNLTEESKKQIEVVKKALAEQPTDEQLNSQGNVVTPTTPKTKTAKSSRKTQTDSVLKSQIKNNAINSLTQVDANGKKVTKTWQDAVREANEEIKKHKC